MAKLNINFDPYLFEKIENCDLSVRAKKLISTNNMKFVGDLVSNIAANEILKFPNAGKKTLNEIQYFLSQKQLFLEMRTNWNNLENKAFLAKEYAKSQVTNIDFNFDNILKKYLVKKSKENDIQFERRKKIITLRFSLDGEFSTLDAVGKQFDITRERIRQIKKNFFNQIKNKEDVKYSIKNYQNL